MKNLANTLSQMFSLSITNLETLREHPAIYKNFFLQLDTFITTIVFCSKKNRNQLLELTQNFGIDTDDIRFDCLERCVTKLSLVLAQDLDHQIPYLYTLCNNMIIDWYRTSLKEYTTIVSLNKTIENHNEKNDSKTTKALEDFTMDTKADTESNFIAKTQVLELLHTHANNADALLCTAAITVLGEKPAQLAQLLLHTGSVEKTLLFSLGDIQELFGISPSELPMLPRIKNTGLNKLILNETTSSKQLSSKISNILHRTKL